MTTASLGTELQEMKKAILEMQANGHEKDAEILQLNMHLAEEKRKLHEIMIGSKGHTLMGSEANKVV